MRCPNLIFLALTVYHTLFCHDKHNLSLLLRSHPILSFSRRRVYVSKSIRDKPRRVCTTLQSRIVCTYSKVCTEYTPTI
ncbi:hypothetical protein PF008_g9963 [Phytophthora fragariae]|uniref:Uncharacterized protein n=1 Tax=Phytophthora fragariae TaxID=53985 RepID=A0A6G0RW21_9STRA|nr:hypothetical protein PF008_g9963 [Phytophthora fragariae]